MKKVINESHTEKKFSILLIDDDADDIFYFTELLGQITNTQFVLETALTLEQAKTLLVEKTYDIAFLDLHLPDGQGPESVKQMRAVAESLPFVVLSGTKDDDVKKKVWNFDIQGFISKSELNTELLEKTIHKAIEKKDSEQDYGFMAQFDSLTGLPNRLLILENLRQSIAVAEKNESKFCFLFIGITNFAQISENYGFDVAEQIIKSFVKKANDRLVGEDMLASFSEDKFVVFFHGFKSIDEISEKVAAFVSTLTTHYQVGSKEVDVSVRVGVSIYPLSSQEKLATDAIERYESIVDEKQLFTFCDYNGVIAKE